MKLVNLLPLILASSLLAATAARAADSLLVGKDVRPILKIHGIPCHGVEEKTKDDLDVLMKQVQTNEIFIC